MKVTVLFGTGSIGLAIVRRIAAGGHVMLGGSLNDRVTSAQRFLKERFGK